MTDKELLTEVFGKPIPNIIQKPSNTNVKFLLLLTAVLVVTTIVLINTNNTIHYSISKQQSGLEQENAA